MQFRGFARSAAAVVVRDKGYGFVKLVFGIAVGAQGVRVTASSSSSSHCVACAANENEVEIDVRRAAGQSRVIPIFSNFFFFFFSIFTTWTV